MTDWGKPFLETIQGKLRIDWKRGYPYLLLLPSFIVLGGVLIYPWLWSFYLSFHSWSPIRPGAPRFIGLWNYIAIFWDHSFWEALKNSLIFMLSTVSFQFLIGFGLALILNRELKGKAIFRTASIIPLMLTPAIVGLIWKVLLHDEWGVVNYFLEEMGFYKIGWLSDPSKTMITIVLIDVWQHSPFITLVLLAGLQAIPLEQYEAGKVDGASAFQLFWYITLPWLKPLILIVLMFRTMFALRAFDVIYSLFRSGGPGNAAMVLGVHLYERLRLTWRIGEGAAISYVLLILTALISFGFVLSLYRGIEE